MSKDLELLYVYITSWFFFSQQSCHCEPLILQYIHKYTSYPSWWLRSSKHMQTHVHRRHFPIESIYALVCELFECKREMKKRKIKKKTKKENRTKTGACVSNNVFKFWMISFLCKGLVV